MNFRNLRRLLAHTRAYRRKLVVGIAGGMGVTVAGVTMPILTRAVIDKAILGHRWTLLLWLIGVIASVGAVRAILHGVRRQFAGDVSISVEGDLRETLYEHVQALDFGYHERVSTGQLMSRASSDLQAIRNFIVFIPLTASNIVLFIAVGVIMLVLSPPLAAFSIAALPLLGFATQKFAARFDDVTWRLQQKIADLAAVVEETVTGIRVVKAFGRESHQVAAINREADAIYEEAVESIRLRAWFVPLFNLIPQIGIIAVLWFGGRLVLSGKLSLGTIVAFNAYLLLLIWPLRMMGILIANAQRASTAVGRVFEVLDTTPGVADRPDAVDIRVSRGEIRYQSVRFSYPGGGVVCDGVELVIPAGTSVALVGPTGCGKSTLARLLPRFIEPTGGRVTIDGVDISGVTLKSLRSEIGMVFEDTFLFSDTIRDNIAFGRPDADYEEVIRAAAVAQAHDFIEELPEGYEAVIGEQGYTLSGGQRQRIAIARAVLMDPRILILDDATSSVDVRIEAEIIKGLARAIEGRTALIIARRPSTASLADRVAYMEAGRILSTGTHHELWENQPGYRDAMTSGGVVDKLVGQIEEPVR